MQRYINITNSFCKNLLKIASAWPRFEFIFSNLFPAVLSHMRYRQIRRQNCILITLIIRIRVLHSFSVVRTT